MKLLANWFDQNDATELLRRLDGLTANAQPRWGTFAPPALVCHLTDPVRVALGEKAVPRLKGPLSLPGVAQFVVWLLPWPKGAPTAPEFLPGTGMTSATDFDKDKRALIDALQRFSELPLERQLPPSPVFGRLSRRAWGRLMWRHLDHHLQQFGL